MSPAWRISAYQPHPPSPGYPSLSHGMAAPVGGPDLPATLHTTLTTTPPEAARITVPRAAPRSTPSWPGRSPVRNPDPTGAGTGFVHPVALIGAGRHSGNVPPPKALTMAVARA